MEYMDMYKNMELVPNQLYTGLKVLEREDQEMGRSERLKSITGPLMAWYETSARVLPWRDDPKPYRVWISEIMLQQTRVEAVKPYFERFMNALPQVKDLAEVPEEELLKLWEGLGYYNRARNLKKAAEIMMERYDETVPSSYEELLSLPGIGSYTAGAVASIAYGAAVPAVDGNVLRVISRVLADREDITKQSVKKRMEQEISAVIPKDRPGDFNQALIEIGAIVCVPNGAPRCEECPLDFVCLAKRRGLISEIPYKPPKKARKKEDRTILILEYEGKIGIHKRPDQGLLASLYEFPNLEGHIKEEDLAEKLGIPQDEVQVIERLSEARHIFSHVEWNMIGYRIIIRQKGGLPYLFAEKRELRDKYPLPNAFAAYMKQINADNV